MAAAASTATGSVALTASAAVRRILLENGNSPLRLLTVFQTMQTRFPELACTKTHFKTKIIMQMVKRGQIVAAKVIEDRKGRAIEHYGMRLKNNRQNRALVAQSGDILPRFKASAAAQTSAPKVSESPALA